MENTEDPYLKWERRFMALAEHVAQWSKDPSTKVGAVIVGCGKKVVGMGYNGFPRYVEDDEDRYNDREMKYGFVVHAEANAIMNSDFSACKHATLYVTLSPCRECAKLIIQSGILRVVYKEYRHDPYTETMFNEAGVSMEQIK